jgi:chromosome segregation protein
MTGDDLLDTGITIMARPPGKKNATIHLLSGGEKALTAIALVFSIFQLNPAPFCILDEVDAPLDDANTGRYARLVKEMSDKVQFIYITHNKISMEFADHLMGVTMYEPGVSRLVSVDVEEAAALAAS